MSNGTIKWFSKKKGYGFIIPDEGGEEIFVHRSEIKDDGRVSLTEGQKVNYDMRQSDKGPCAANVVLTQANQLKG
jgi:CspA family cold shock protein